MKYKFSVAYRKISEIDYIKSQRTSLNTPKSHLTVFLYINCQIIIREKPQPIGRKTAQTHEDCSWVLE